MSPERIERPYASLAGAKPTATRANRLNKNPSAAQAQYERFFCLATHPVKLAETEPKRRKLQKKTMPALVSRGVEVSSASKRITRIRDAIAATGRISRPIRLPGRD